MPNSFRKWEVGGKPVLSTKEILDAALRSGYPAHWTNLANGMRFPRGQSHGQATFLMRKEYSDQLAGRGPFDITGFEYTQSKKDQDDWKQTRKYTWKRWWVSKTYAATESNGNNVPAMVVELVDVRYHLAHAATNRRFNLRDSDWIDDTLNSGTPYTWQQVLSTIWGDLPTLAGTCPTLASAPASTPENLLFEGVSAWESIGRILMAAGHVLVLDPFTDTMSFAKMTATQANVAAKIAASKNEGRWIWEWSPDLIPSVQLPKEVKVTFPRGPSDTGAYAPFSGLPKIKTSSISSLGQAGTTWPVKDTIIVRGSDASPTNDADLIARATEIADAVKGYFRPASEPSGSVYGGFVDFVPGSEVTVVNWKTDHDYGTRTDLRNTMIDEFIWPEFPNAIGSGGGTPAITFIITAFDEATRIATADVKFIICTGSNVELGDSVLVYDFPLQCNFHNEGTSGELVGRRGTAHWGKYLDQYGIETECRWVCFGLCCPTEE